MWVPTLAAETCSHRKFPAYATARLFKAWLFEPNPYNFKQLSTVVAADARLTAFEQALGPQKGEMPFYGIKYARL
jgi:hypothetical protein